MVVYLRKVFREEWLNSLLLVMIFVFLSVWWAVIHFWFGGKNVGANQVWTTTYQAVAILGFYLGFHIIRKTRGQSVSQLPRRAILFFSSGLLFQAIGQTIYSFYVLVFKVEVAYPSFADIFYFGSALLYLIAIFFLAHEAIPRNKRKKAIGLSLFIFTGALLGQFGFLKKTVFPFTLEFESVLTVIYYLIEILYVSISLCVLFLFQNLKNNKFRLGFLLLCLALCLQFIAEFNFFYTSRIGTWVNAGSGDYLYLLTYFLTGLGLVQFAGSFVAMNMLVVVFNAFFFIQFLLSGSLERFFSNGVLFLVCMVISFLLVERNKNEVAQRETEARLRALEESNRQLQELDRQKSEFLTIAAHQLRTPLSTIKSYVSMIQDGDYGDIPPAVQHTLSDVDASNEWLVRLADDFLTIAHLDQGQTTFRMNRVDLLLIIQNVLAEFIPKAKQKNMTFRFDHSLNTAILFCDEDKVKVCLTHFLDNVIQYGKKDTEEAATVFVHLVQEPGVYTVRIIDQGIGFSEKDEARFFRKFSRGENVKGIHVNVSKGLGLYIARKFIEGHGGKVWAKSEGLGKGSEFGFWIPYAKDI